MITAMHPNLSICLVALCIGSANYIASIINFVFEYTPMFQLQTNKEGRMPTRVESTARCTVPNRRFLPSQQYNRRQTEHKGSSSLCAIEPLATGISSFISHLCGWVWSTALSNINSANRSNNCGDQFEVPFHPVRSRWGSLPCVHPLPLFHSCQCRRAL